jgi:anti-anti-sigma factor
MPVTQPLQIQVERLPDSAMIRLIGEANVHSVDMLQQELTLLSALRPARVVVDLSGLTFVSSLALGVLVEFHRGLARNQVQVQLTGLSPAVREVFASTGLDQVFSIV